MKGVVTVNNHAEMLSSEYSPLAVRLAERTDEIEQALRLRYRVFVEEIKNLPQYNESGIEQDEFDQYCDHLIVTDPVLDQVVGTYRLLPGERTVGIGFYSETEFDLSGFQANRFQTLELGRSCVAPEYRRSNALKMLWTGIANYLSDHPYKYLIGCASLHVIMSAGRRVCHRWKATQEVPLLPEMFNTLIQEYGFICG